MPPLELEADKYSGFVLYNMGAALSDAKAAMSLISNPSGSVTHPPRSARLTAITNGWLEARDIKKPSGDAERTPARRPVRRSPPPPPPPPRHDNITRYIHVRNQCNVPVDVAMIYQDVHGHWVQYGWINLTHHGAYLYTNIATSGKYVYFYGEGGTHRWQGSDDSALQRYVTRNGFNLHGLENQAVGYNRRLVSFFRVDLTGKDENFDQPFHCVHSHY